MAAYRSLGGAAPGAGDSGALLRSAHALLRGSVEALTAQLAAADAPVDPDATAAGRKTSAAVQQALDRLPPAAELDAGSAAARTLLAAAAEDVGWAWRMLQAPSLSTALTAAAALLGKHAAGCCAEAETLLAVPLGGEPADRA